MLVNSDLLFFINYWLPWLSLITESFLLQYIIIYLLYILLYNNNIYYILLTVVIITFFSGLFLATYQLELFTAFLWLVELSVFFVFLLLLFYVNIKGVVDCFSIKYNIYIILFCCVFAFFLFSYCDLESYGWCITYYDDVYTSLISQINNDFYGIFISYYYINVCEFILVGAILLIGSVFCITLFKINSVIATHNYTNFFKVFNFFNNFLNFFFVRKQNLLKQGFSKESLRFFKKK